jgi:hypothetical protein
MSRPVLIFRESLIAGPPVAMLVAAAAVMAEHDPSIEHWLTLAAWLVVPLALFIAAARLARRFIGELFPGTQRVLFVGVVAWIVLSFPIDALLGWVLKVTTHHRGLGGATFGALALGANLAAALLGWRLSVTLARRGGAVAGLLNACLALAMAVVVVLAARAAMSSGYLLGGLVAALSTVLAARWDARQKPDPDPPQPI